MSVGLEFSLVPNFISTWYVSQYGKFSKPQVLYTPANVNPPPVAWIYQCQYCKYFIYPNRCVLVSEKGPPDPGEINPHSWCILWTNRKDEPPFSWIIRIFERK